MKIIVGNLAKVTASLAAMLTLSIGLSNTSLAQSVRLPGDELILASAYSTQNIDVRANVSSIDPRTATHAEVGVSLMALSAELPKAVDQALDQLSIEKLMQGESKATAVVGGAASILDEQAICVKVKYEARPVGGILTVSASLTPTFRGVGVSTRPSASRSVAMAVDGLDENQVKDLARELTAEINGEFADAGLGR